MSKQICKESYKIPLVDDRSFIPLYAKYFTVSLKQFLGKNIEAAIFQMINRLLDQNDNYTVVENHAQSAVSFERQAFFHKFDSSIFNWNCSHTNIESMTSVEFNLCVFKDSYSTTNEYLIKFNRLRGCSLLFGKMMNSFFSHANTLSPCGPWVAISPRKINISKSTVLIPRTWNDCNSTPIRDQEFTNSCNSLINWLRSDLREGLSAVHKMFPALWNHAITLLNEHKPWEKVQKESSQNTVKKFGELFHVICKIAFQAFRQLFPSFHSLQEDIKVAYQGDDYISDFFLLSQAIQSTSNKNNNNNIFDLFQNMNTSSMSQDFEDILSRLSKDHNSSVLSLSLSCMYRALSHDMVSDSFSGQVLHNSLRNILNMDANFKLMILYLRKIDPRFMLKVNSTEINSISNDVVSDEVDKNNESIEHKGVSPNVAKNIESRTFKNNTPHSATPSSNFTKRGYVDEACTPMISFSDSTKSQKKSRNEFTAHQAQDISIFAQLLSTQML